METNEDLDKRLKEVRDRVLGMRRAVCARISALGGELKVDGGFLTTLPDGHGRRSQPPALPVRPARTIHASANDGPTADTGDGITSVAALPRSTAARGDASGIALPRQPSIRVLRDVQNSRSLGVQEVDSDDGSDTESRGTLLRVRAGAASSYASAVADVPARLGSSEAATSSGSAGSGPIVRPMTGASSTATGPAGFGIAGGVDRAKAITMTLIPDEALVSPRYVSDKVAENKTLPPKEQRHGLTRFRVPDKAKQQLREPDGGLWGLLNPKAFT